MTLAQRNRFRLIFAVGLIIIVGITMAIRIAIAPTTEQMIRTQVGNQASDAINAAIADRIAAGDFDYNKMVTVEKNAAGTVSVSDSVGSVMVFISSSADSLAPIHPNR